MFEQHAPMYDAAPPALTNVTPPSAAHLCQLLAVLALGPQAHQQKPDVEAEGGVGLLEIGRDAHGCSGKQADNNGDRRRSMQCRHRGSSRPSRAPRQIDA